MLRAGIFRATRLIGCAAVCCMALAACGDTTTGDTGAASERTAGQPDPDAAAGTVPAAVQRLDIVGTEYSFAVEQHGSSAAAGEHGSSAAAGEHDSTTSPAPLHAGWTRVSFHNRGREAHQVMFAAPKDGVDLAELAAAAGGDSSGSAAIAYVDMLGGVSYVGPGQSVDALVNLPEGIVLAMCYVPDAHGVAHALSGMTTMFDIGPATDAQPTESSEPIVGAIEMSADGYLLPDRLTPGWYRVTNTDTRARSAAAAAGTGLHELAILGLDEPLQAGELEQLLDDLANNKTPAATLDALGGMGALSAGLTGYVWLDLKPGPYLGVDFMPDPGSPRPHLLDGYATEFDVTK
jgi:hypothetical protein